ncbi:MAG: hypothetical protein HY775_12160 [Acidobacteria bacterium]|nr:hypothetical protein [Acidobacteriota bacterium]
MRAAALALVLVLALPVAARADSTPPVPTTAPPATLAAAARVSFDEPVHRVTSSNVVLRISYSSANVPATVGCRDRSGARVSCSSGSVRTVLLQQSAPLVAGQRYGVVVNPSGADPLTDFSGNPARRATVSFRAPSDQQEWSAGVVYGWRSVSDSSAMGGSFVTERSAGASATYRFTGTSVSWYTIVGPDQGIARVSVDGVAKGSFDQFSAKRRYGVRRAFGGLSSGAHRIAITVRGAGRAAATGALVAVDALGAGSSVDRSPPLAAGWRKVRAADASGDGYAASDLAGSRARITFRGPGIDWYTVAGPDRGKASVYLDGTYRTRFDDFSSSVRYGVRRSIRGLSDAVHTLSVRVLGQKRDGSTGSVVTLDRWVVRRPSVAAFKRLGAWVDLYDYSLDPRSAVADMDARGVRTVFLQTSRYSRAADIEAPKKDPGYVGRWVESAHAAGMRIVGWYLPGYGDLDRDVRRTVAIARFRSPAGQGFDALGVDIEYKGEVDNDLHKFNAGIATHLRRVRSAVGLFAVGAITPAPLGMAIRPKNWEGFPWDAITRYSDVVLPMAYWSYRKSGSDPQFTCPSNPDYCAYRYTKGNVAASRRLTKGLPVHDLGGVADNITTGEVADFARGADESSAYGASLYDYRTTSEEFWAPLARINRL